MKQLLTILLCIITAMPCAAQPHYREQVRKFISHPLAKTSPLRLGQRLLLDASLPDHVDPLLTDEWHQESEPYTRYTPLEDSVHCVVGCVALAMGEVMRYHEWPSTYDWDNMLDHYRGEYTEAQAEAVGRLLSDCGLAVDMEYGKDASSARSICQLTALVDSFGYDRGAQMYYRDFFSRSDWHNMFRRELAAGRPILISACSATLCHAFVCDGYNAEGMFHILWGNPTKDEDGWYNLDIMTPDQPKWYEKDNPERGLNLWQCMAVGVQPPQQGTKETHVFVLESIKPKEAMTSIGSKQPFDVVTHNFANIGRNMLDGRVALALKKGDSVVRILSDYEHEFLLEELDDTIYTDTLTISIDATALNGSYRIVPVFEDNGEWEEALTSRGIPNYIGISIKDGIIAFDDMKASTASLSLARLTFPDTIMHRAPTRFSIDIRNDGDVQFCGRIYFTLTLPDSSVLDNAIQCQGMYIEPGQTIHREFYQTPLYAVGPGHYLLNILVDNSLMADTVASLDGYATREITVVSYDPSTDIAPQQQGSMTAKKPQHVTTMQGYTIQHALPNQIIITEDGKKRSIQDVP